jgi:hypothetical protein
MVSDSNVGDVRLGSWLCENPSERPPRARLIQTERCSRKKDSRKAQARDTVWFNLLYPELTLAFCCPGFGWGNFSWARG